MINNDNAVFNDVASRKINHLRAFAALWVFIFHYEHFVVNGFFTPLNSYNPFKVLAYNGYMGVSLFFCLSGFLFARVYREKKIRISTFYIKRLLRILPAYIFIIVVYVLVSEQPLENIFDLLSYVFNINLIHYPDKIGHLWSVNRELQCYALFPLLWWIVNIDNFRWGLWLYLIVLLGSLFYGLEDDNASITQYYGSFILRFSEFLLGVIVGIKYYPIRVMKFQPWVLILIFIVLLLGYQNMVWEHPLKYSVLSILWLSISGYFGISAIVIYLSMKQNLPPFFDKLFNVLGEISYSFYLIHLLIMSYLKTELSASVKNEIVLFCLTLLICLGMAFISYYLTERPGQKIKKYLL